MNTLLGLALVSLAGGSATIGTLALVRTKPADDAAVVAALKQLASAQERQADALVGIAAALRSNDLRIDGSLSLDGKLELEGGFSVDVAGQSSRATIGGDPVPLEVRVRDR